MNAYGTYITHVNYISRVSFHQMQSRKEFIEFDPKYDRLFNNQSNRQKNMSFVLLARNIRYIFFKTNKKICRLVSKKRQLFFEQTIRAVVGTNPEKGCFSLPLHDSVLKKSRRNLDFPRKFYSVLI